MAFSLDIQFDRQPEELNLVSPSPGMVEEVSCTFVAPIM